MSQLKRTIVVLSLFLFLQAPLPLKPDPQLKISVDLLTAMVDPRAAAEPLHVWVYFRDKGLKGEAGRLQAVMETQQILRARCQWRRAKVRPATNLADFEDVPLSAAYTDQVQPLVTRVRAVSRWLNAMSVEATPEQVRALAALDCVAGLDTVRGFQGEKDPALPVNRFLAGPSSPSPIYGPAFSQLNQINVLPLHQQGLSGRGVLVCLLDVGFRKSHEVFRLAHLVAEWDFVFSDGDVQQNLDDPKDYSDSHGTATWSLLGGFKFGQMVGPAFGADFILARTEDDRSETPIEEDYWAAGIEWAESLGAEVVSSSLGYTDWYQFKDMDGRTAVTTRAANRAASLGVVVVNAAGNERRNAWGHIIAPADGFDVIAAGAVDSSNKIASFSSPGPTYDGRIKPEVCALGVNNWIAQNRAQDASDYYTRGSGTSFATPLIGGVAALLLEAHRDWTPSQVRAALMNTAGNAAAPNNDFGWGIVNAAAAASAAPSPARRR
jgi:subtilisin family serine protease